MRGGAAPSEPRAAVVPDPETNVDTPRGEGLGGTIDQLLGEPSAVMTEGGCSEDGGVDLAPPSPGSAVVPYAGRVCTLRRWVLEVGLVGRGRALLGGGDVARANLCDEAGDAPAGGPRDSPARSKDRYRTGGGATRRLTAERQP